jgi:hypothetical protein
LILTRRTYCGEPLTPAALRARLIASVKVDRVAFLGVAFLDGPPPMESLLKASKKWAFAGDYFA